jgi:leader peptidase (prepilin peptidase)/N-methyltransferase
MAIILMNISLIDFKTQEIPFELSVPFMLLCIGKYVGEAIEAQNYLLVNILGFVCPAVFFGLIYLIPYLIKKIEVIGLGDVILYSFIGLALGGWNIILVVLISTLLCSVVELIKIKVTGNKTTIAFGPYIAIATLICMVFGNVIVDAYLSLIGL